MFRAILGSVVLLPLRRGGHGTIGRKRRQTTRALCTCERRAEATPVIYENDEQFPIGGCKVLRQSDDDVATIVAAGITLHEALAAHDELRDKGIAVRVIDLYSVKPLDAETLQKAARETGRIVTVEDHFAEGGIAEAVRSALADHPVPVDSLCVRRKPKSGQPDELLEFEEISHKAIVLRVMAHQTEK